MVISAGLVEKMEATIEAELVAEEEGKIYTAVDLFRLPVSDHHYNQYIPSHITSPSSSSSFQVLRCKTIILLVCWVTCASLYYVLLLDQSELSEVNFSHLNNHLTLLSPLIKENIPCQDLYLGFLITAGVQLPGYVYVILTLERPMFGRKRWSNISSSMCHLITSPSMLLKLKAADQVDVLLLAALRSLPNHPPSAT